ncbi:sigma 54-interacting transcriptional regulator [Terriglobus saanensis]|uniref:Putative magnesium chelatase, ChlI subunit n=1 Tax=Terriglobus saanensis (strain ATCC BAA-1853 / DSM 23119 / SP1PR4) TaxID=401053 RepID=E8V6F7_TERSS|nr:sigma 54-interacting transcriptional regulator [Terriglobus saanensis]ADV81622.1 putative magnesium chelatase, ChlI subunit [Terriglobus saanensis SP1PR4]
MKSLPVTLGELRKSEWTPEYVARSVKDELRDNLIVKLRAKEAIFPGIVGYEDTVTPQIVNAVLSKHNFILLGLRGQAKSRILRALTTLLDEKAPYVAGSELRDNPYAPLSKYSRDLIATMGDDTPIAWMGREERYVEKLATPDVTVADLIGDVDPIKAARSGEILSSELTMHYGLLPRANRGIFAINEIPDLAGKIQVALFNIMQEGDVQIKGYPVRLELDVAIVFSANPEDYTARGKIVTPLKDRIGSEIRTHYLDSLDQAISVTEQEAWSKRGGLDLHIPRYIREVVEQIAFTAREEKRVDKRSGVSQRLPISTLELVISNAERRALLHGESTAVPRIGDIYTALPGITGKIELEYEGEMRGADKVVHEIINTAVAHTFDGYFADVNTQQIEEWFNLGGTVQLSDATSSEDSMKELRTIQGLAEKLKPLKLPAHIAAEQFVSAAEFLLEGMTAHKRISRTEERSFTAIEKRNRDRSQGFQEEIREREREKQEWQSKNRNKRGFN